MVQHKYFGDSRDYFKYDLIKTVLENAALRHYVFIPMLTEHRDDAEGKVSPKDRGDKSPELLHFIRSCDGKSLKHWRSWVARYAESYSTVEPVDETYFSDAPARSVRAISSRSAAGSCTTMSPVFDRIHHFSRQLSIRVTVNSKPSSSGTSF